MLQGVIALDWTFRGAANTGLCLCFITTDTSFFLWRWHFSRYPLAAVMKELTTDSILVQQPPNPKSGVKSTSRVNLGPLVGRSQRSSSRERRHNCVDTDFPKVRQSHSCVLVLRTSAEVQLLHGGGPVPTLPLVPPGSCEPECGGSQGRISRTGLEQLPSWRLGPLTGFEESVD